MAHDGEAQAETPVVPCRAHLCLLKPLEQMREKFGRNPLAAVAHGNLDSTSRLLQPDLDPATRRSELDRVGQKIPDHLLETLRIRADRFHIVAHDGVEIDSLRVRRGTPNL